MIKFLLIAVLVIYSFYRVANFLFKFVYGGFGKDQFNSTKYNNKRTSEGKVNVDRSPQSAQGKKNGYQGGEYVDYEEVK